MIYMEYELPGMLLEAGNRRKSPVTLAVTTDTTTYRNPPNLPKSP
jgi:hypothetical protein